MTTASKDQTRAPLVTFAPDDQSIRGRAGETLLDAARRAGVRIAAVCGGRGLCKACVVRITEGEAGEPSEQDRAYFTAEQLDANWRRACQITASGDCRVEIPPRSKAAPVRTLVEGTDVWVHPDPAVRVFRVRVPEASLESPTADDHRLLAALNKKWAGTANTIDIGVLRSLPRMLSDHEGHVGAALCGGEVIGLLPAKKRPLLGLAVDVGTTNIGFLLVDLRSGRTLESMGLENPQALHGGDIVTRMAHAIKSEEALESLHELVIDGINRAAQELCARRSMTPAEIADVSIAGNTAMHHLFLRLPVRNLALAPFVPAVSAATDVKARDLGITAMPGASVHMMPNIAGYVGGDHTAVLLAIAGDTEEGTALVLDIGTNTEISLIHAGRITSVSCPSGPALEGGHIQCGMRSAPGAIEAVRIDGDELQMRTIDDAPPSGVCGSGVLDLTAELYRNGVINAAGRMQENHPRVRSAGDRREFVLASEEETNGHPVVFTQADVRSVQLAKGAIQAGIQILLDRAGLRADDLDQVVVAGAFGNYIRLASAVAIGVLPDIPLERFAQIGNAAGIGAKLALVSHPHRAEAQFIAAEATYVELAGTPEFQTTFMKSIGFPPVKNEETVLQQSIKECDQ